MQLTRAADYAVRVMIHLAGLPPGTRVSRSELSTAAECPEQFLCKVLQNLGSILTDCGHFRQGTQALTRAIDLNPNMASSHLLLAQALLGHGCLLRENRKDAATMREANRKLVYKTRGFITHICDVNSCL